MKNQYFGDVGDYGKYGLLRFLRQHGITIAVNWYLTEGDGSNDGKHITYLEKNEFWKYDPKLYTHLKEYVIVQNRRDVSLIEESGLIRDAKFYSQVIDDPTQYVKVEREIKRKGWHKAALQVCGGADLVFLDPDNGFRNEPPKDIKSQVKYCYANEIQDYYDSGSDVVYYTSKGRRTDEQWESTKKQMADATKDAVMFGLTFHKGTQRSYIFAVHPRNKKAYENLLDKFLQTNWKDMFTIENIQ